MLTATNIDRGFNSVTSVFTFNLHARTFALSNQKYSQIIKKKKLRKDRCFSQQVNNGQAQFKFKATSAAIARQGWMAILYIIFWRNSYADRDKAMTEATTASFLLFPATTQRRYAATETWRQLSVTGSDPSVCGMCFYFFVVSNRTISPNSQSKQIKVPKEDNGPCLINQHQDSCVYAQVKLCLDRSVIKSLCSHNMTW